MRLAIVVSLAAAVSAQTHLSPQDAAQGWVALFDGETLYGWKSEGGAVWKVDNGAIVSEAGEYGWLRSDMPFADFEMRIEYRQAADGNSGIFLRSAREGAPHQTGYELQIFDTHPQFPTGSIVGHRKAGAVKAPAGEWNKYEIRVEGDRFVVKLNGQQVLDGRDAKSKFGYIGLQHNKDKKIEFRNIAVRPLGLKPIFDGKTLKGWREVQPPKPAKVPAIWRVEDGAINALRGPGQLETEGVWKDFILQLDIRANAEDPARHPNSGVFFRGEPGGWWSGYESQIRNEFKDGDPSQPVDTGTGGIYFHHPARRVVARDNEFFTKTILASGRQIAIWVNGYLVSSWEDPHPEGASVRNKEAVLRAGTFSLQAHDPTTNLDFRNIRVVALP